MSYQYKLIALILNVLLISGCSGFLPGMSFNNPALQSQQNEIAIKPSVISVTPQVISNLKMQSYDYEVAAGDQLLITVWNHPEFSSPQGLGLNSSGSTTIQTGIQTSMPANNSSSSTVNVNTNGYLVNPQGQIFFPLLGEVQVNGLTSDAIAARITTGLSKYVKNPQVSVYINGFNSQQVYVMGEINTPGLLPITNTSLSLAKAINLAGGLNLNTADAKQIYVIRGNLTTPTIYWLNGESPVGMLLAQGFTLENHDIIFVAPAGIVRWNRVINQLLPSIQTVWYTQSIVQNS